MTETIRQTITRALEPYRATVMQWSPEANKVVDEVTTALEEREANIADYLRVQARSAGMRQPMVEQALIEAGLSGVRTGPAEPSAPWMASPGGAEQESVTAEQRGFLEDLRGLLARCEQMVRDARERFKL